MTPLQIILGLARAQGNPALPLMVPAAVRALMASARTPRARLPFDRPAARLELLALHDAGAIELRPDAGNALTAADLALCPRGAGGVALCTLVVREVPCSRCGKPLTWDGVDACSSCLEAFS